MYKSIAGGWTHFQTPVEQSVHPSSLKPSSHCTTFDFKNFKLCRVRPALVSLWSKTGKHTTNKNIYFCCSVSVERVRNLIVLSRE